MHPSDARELARSLMHQHNLVGWRFAFDHARRRFGCCKFSQKLITLSRPLTMLNPEDQVRDTLLHEIAHALTPGEGHGPRWKAKCIELGAKPQRCYTDEIVTSPPRAPARYRMGCRPCNWWVDRRRLTFNRYVCAKCRGHVLYQDKSSGALFRISRGRNGSMAMVEA